MFMELRPCFTEIDLKIIEANYKNIKDYVNKDVIGVVKANAYGHGAIEVSQILVENGVAMLAVATVEEALEIRDVIEYIPILILGPVPDCQKSTCILNDISFIVSSSEEARTTSLIAKKFKKTALIHIALDTGMSRVGFFAHSKNNPLLDELLSMLNLEFINFEGIFTHFATADESDLDFMKNQYSSFKDIVLNLLSKGFLFKYIHCQNSAASVTLEDSICNCVRAGIYLYGYYPSGDVEKNIVISPALKWKCRISHIKTVPPGTPVGYGSTYVTSKTTKIATIPVGYADGFRRSMSNKFKVSYKNHDAKIIGRVCMDQSMIDISSLDCKIGEYVNLIDERNTADCMAQIDNTISYEVLCGISARVPRTYLR